METFRVPDTWRVSALLILTMNALANSIRE
jgi:hypothetical protein